MKKISLFLMSTAMALTASAQEFVDTDIVFDAREDTTNVVTITDIIAVQEMVTSHNSSDAHFRKVWSYNSYFNLGYNTSSTLTPKEEILSGLNETQLVEPFKSDWGLSLTLGHNYRLHKKPIANVLQFNLDYTYINLHVNHFKAADGNKLFDSSLMRTVTDQDGVADKFHYIPWNMDKYEFNYSMQLGPSLTIAPFTYVHAPQLHFLKFNIYYHIGYELSMMVIANDKKFDANPTTLITTASKEMNSSSKQNWAHGLTNTFGFSINWKSIGLGWETSKSTLKYQSLQKELFGDTKYKFSDVTNRIYLQIRY